MEDKDKIQELFSQKLGNYEAKVDPSLWNGVASQLGNTAVTAASTGVSLLTKVIVGASISIAVITTTILLVPSDSNPSAEQSSIASNKENVEISKNVSTPVQTSSVDKEEVTKETDRTSLVDERNQEEITAFSEEIENSFEMPVTEFPEQLIDEDCIDCDLVERVEESSETGEESSQTAGESNEEVIQREEATEEEVREVQVPKPVYYIEQYINVFSPNGDGNNDIFSLKIQGLTEFKISILDFNDGKELFESRDVNFTWDGTDKAGNQVKKGDYIFIITALDFDENPIREIKSLTIAR